MWVNLLWLACGCSVSAGGTGGVGAPDQPTQAEVDGAGPVSSGNGGVGSLSPGLAQGANLSVGGETVNPVASPLPAGPTVSLPANGNGNGNANGNQTGTALGGNQSGTLVQDSRYPYALVGRFDLRNPNQVVFNFPGSKVGVAFTGNSLAVKLNDTGADTFDVTIDGVEYASPGDAFNVATSSATTPCLPAAQVPAWDGNNYPGCILATANNDVATPTTYTVATNLGDGNHVAWLTKRSEFLQGQCGTVTLHGFVLAPGGKLLPAPPYYARRIEFVGDSSTSGFGAGQRAPCNYTSRNCDAGRAIPTMVSQYLRAEHVNLSSSGQGVYRSFYDRTLSHNLPVLYRQTVGLRDTPRYDFSLDHVDAVVLSAGGDDLWGAPSVGAFDNNDPNATGTARNNFVATYTAWLAEIRSLRPDAVLFVTLTYGAYGGDVATLGDALKEAVAARTAAGDANVLYYSYFPAQGTRGSTKPYTTLGDVTQGEGVWLGCKGHPAPSSSRYLGGLLGAFVAARMGWSDVGY